jgi:hypothetical protein
MRYRIVHFKNEYYIEREVKLFGLFPIGLWIDSYEWTYEDIETPYGTHRTGTQVPHKYPVFDLAKAKMTELTEQPVVIITSR